MFAGARKLSELELPFLARAGELSFPFVFFCAPVFFFFSSSFTFQCSDMDEDEFYLVVVFSRTVCYLWWAGRAFTPQ